VGGFLAIALQHEIDHLNGVLILDRISGLKRQLFRTKLRKRKKEQEADSKS
jgi:peptide deformylase